MNKECKACELNTNPPEELGGIVYESRDWRIEHCESRFGEGAFVVKPRRHVEFLDELTANELKEFGQLAGHLTEAIREVIPDTERVYVNFWGEETRHVHFVFQPRTKVQIEQYGTGGPRMQAIMFDEFEMGKELNKTRVRKISEQIRDYLNS